MNWFRRHLNWTLLLAWLVVPFVLAMVAELTGVPEIAILVLPWLLVVLCVWWWVLCCKGRSHWWILLGGLGVLITFGLRNKKEDE